jgi:predicted DNA-binding protein
MKRNITLSLDKDLIKRGRILAAKKETSLSGLLRDLIKQSVEEKESYEVAKKNALEILSKGFHMGGKITYSRDSLHER